MTTTASRQLASIQWAGRVVGMLGQHARGRLACWLSAAAVIAGTTAATMWQVVTSAGKAPIRGTTDLEFGGMDFASTTWHAVRGLLAGQDVYTASTRIAGVGLTWPAGEHVPATLTWQAPFAALPLWAGFVAFDFCGIAAIWAAVFILTRPRSPQAVLVAACCGAFAIFTGGGKSTLWLGQPTGFELLGVAILVSARKPWVAAVGFLLATCTFQTGVPLALALIVLRAWPIVWRGAVLVAALSLPAVVLGISAAGGPMPYVRVFTMSAFGHLETLPGQPRQLADQPNRIDLAALLRHGGIVSTGVQMGAGLLVLALCLLLLVRLPDGMRRISYPPVLCLVIAATILCVYHQPYDMLLVAGVIPVVLLAGDRSAFMLGVFAAADLSVFVSDRVPARAIVDPVCLMTMVVLGALAARRAERRGAAYSLRPASSELTSTSAVADG
jgi:hypothetical protein